MSSHDGPAATGTHDEPAEPRGDRRRARTRQRLIGAARLFLQSPGYAEKPVAEITEAADIGLGSFYNHFSSKQELFAAAVNEVLDEHGDLLDAATAGERDPAAVLCRAIRSTGRLVIVNPEMAHIIATQGMAVLDADSGMIPRARRVIGKGIKTGRFTAQDPELFLAALVGSLLALLHLWLRDRENVDETWCDNLAERLLVLLGVDAAEATRLAHAPMPADQPATDLPADPPAAGPSTAGLAAPGLSGAPEPQPAG